MENGNNSLDYKEVIRMSKVKWKMEITCGHCGHARWKRFWEPTNEEGVKIQCINCGAEDVIPHGFGINLTWMFQIDPQ